MLKRGHLYSFTLKLGLQEILGNILEQRGSWGCPLKLKHLCKPILHWKGVSNKDLEIYYSKGGQGACPLKLKHLCKPILVHVKRRAFATFYPERGSPTNIWKYLGFRGLAPEAEAFLVNLGVQRKTFITFYPERGSPTKIWKYIMAKGVKGLAPWSWSIFCKFGFSKEEICNILPWKGGVSNKELEIHYSKGGQGLAPWSLGIFKTQMLKRGHL